MGRSQLKNLFFRNPEFWILDMTTNGKVFLVDDEKVVRLSLKRELQNKNYAVEDFESAQEALSAISEDWPGVLVSDVMMPNMNGDL